MPAVRQKLHLSSCADFRDRLLEPADCVLHRTIVRVQKMFFDPLVLESGRMPRTNKWER